MHTRITPIWCPLRSWPRNGIKRSVQVPRPGARMAQLEANMLSYSHDEKQGPTYSRNALTPRRIWWRICDILFRLSKYRAEYVATCIKICAQLCHTVPSEIVTAALCQNVGAPRFIGVHNCHNAAPFCILKRLTHLQRQEIQDLQSTDTIVARHTRSRA